MKFTLAAAGILTIATLSSSKSLAETGDTLTWNRIAEVPTKDFAIAATDLKEGVLFFTVDGQHLYFRPQSDDSGIRVAAISSILNELRQATTVVVSYSDQEDQIATLAFPAFSLVKDSTRYNLVGAFYLKYGETEQGAAANP